MNPAISVSDEALAGALADAREVAEFVGSEFAHGALRALAWLSGDGPAPLDPSLGPPDRPNIVRLAGLAEDAVYGRSSHSRDFVVGVENALSWAQGRSPSPPL